jgi:photosystem II stability/assembly factor-like uncharacterized protein
MMDEIILLAAILTLCACVPQQESFKNPPEILIQQSGSNASFRGLAVKNENEAWISGTNGTVLKTLDGGRLWQKVNVPGADSLDFRDIELLNEHSILLMSIGTGEDSRIFKSADSGQNWKTVFVNEEPDAFFDGFDFWNENTGILISDAIDEKLYLLKTEDAGEQWNRVGAETLPNLGKGEYGFAASGTGITTFGQQKVWIVTGGTKSRVFYSPDQGANWSVFDTPMISGKPSTGSFSITFKDEQNGVAVGGDYQIDSAAINNVIQTNDGGKTWSGIEKPETVPFKSCVTYLGNNEYLAVGTSGVSWSSDDGKCWTTIDTTSFHTMDFDEKSRVGWMAGGNGVIAKFVVK